MFERYTERARRVLFFGRYEASQLGSHSIETEHLLLGLFREGKGLASKIFAQYHLSLENIRREIEGRTVFREKISTSVEIPFSPECKRVLGYTAEEANRLRHDYIGTEHLLLGILREERSEAASILMDKGMRLHTLREDIVHLRDEHGEVETEHHNLPDYLPSQVVHITYAQSFDASTPGPATAHRGQPWFALGKTLTQIVAFAWGSEESGVQLATDQLDGEARYDFTIVLPSTDTPQIIPRLLRQAIERDFNVEVTREEGERPKLIITAR
jgi:hypothetical protein